MKPSIYRSSTAIAYAALVIANRIFHLGLTDAELAMIAGVAGTFILGKSGTDIAHTIKAQTPPSE